MKLNDNISKRLLKIEWLQNCGNPQANPSKDYVRTLGKDVFLKSARNSWDNTRLAARGDVTSYLAVHAPEKFNKHWNTLVQQAKNQILPQIEPCIEKRIVELGLPKSVSASIQFDVINILVVLSYQDIVRSPFHEKLLEAYAEGFFPCGWDGKYPDGYMLVL